MSQNLRVGANEDGPSYNRGVPSPTGAWLLLAVLLLPHSASAQPLCSTWQACRDEAIAARDRGDAEAFHDLAWRAVQTGPRNDPTLMFLLARAQSVSGRPHDALVMVERLLDRNLDLTDAETSDDFRRLRSLPGWPDLLGRIRGAPRPAASVETPEEGAPTARAVDSPKTAKVGPPPVRAPTPAKPKAVPAPTTAIPALAAAAAAAPTAKSPAPPARTSSGTAPMAAWPLPASIATPLALAYDGVSGRLVMADGESETLKVLSELSGNAADLVSRGWGGPYRTTAMAIDHARGDLWVVAGATDEDATSAPSVLHRLQLISGRLLYSVPAATDRGAIAFSALAVAEGRVYVLDAAGGRLFELLTGQKTLRERAALEVDGATGLAIAGPDVAYVAHAQGLLRVMLTGGRPVRVSSGDDIPLSGLRWIGYHGRSILGVQRQPDGSHVAVRLRLDGRGRRIMAREELGTAASPAAAIMRDVFYYVAPQGDGSTAVARVLLR